MATTGNALWPSATTYPNTNVYPGQGTVPFIRCLISYDDYTAPTRTWNDMSARLRAWSVDRGRPNELTDFDAGSATFTLENRDRQLDPNINTSIRPMNKVWLYEEFSGEVRDLFVGYAESYQQEWPGGGWSNALTTVRAADEFKVLNLSEFASGTSFPSVAQAGTRIGDLLDAAVENAPRRLDPGRFDPAGALSAVTLASDSSVLTEIASAMSFELASGGVAFFVAASGTLTFYDSDHRGTLSVAATFDDDGTDLAYTDLTIDYSEAFLFNSVLVTGAAGATARSSDATSIARYGKRSLSVDAPELSVSLGNTAAAYIANYKNPLQRITSITPNMGDPETMRVCFARELLDKIEVFRTPPGGGARLDQVSYIQNINWSGTNDGGLPVLKMGISPL